MRTLNGGSRGDDDMRALHKRVNDQIDLLSRRISRMPKIPEAATGGITGVTRLTAGSITQTNDVSPVGSGVFFQDYTIAPLFGDAVSVTEDIDGKITFADAGFYECRAYVRLAWDSTDTVDEVRLSADFSGADPYPLAFERLGSADGLGGSPSLRSVFSWGPFYVEAGGWTSFGVAWMTNENCFLSAMALDVWRVG